MEINIKWFETKFGPQFNIGLSSKSGAEEFLSIKGCQIKTGANGEFISYPAQKKEDGTYWKHVWASEGFNTAVLEKANQTKNATRPNAKVADDADLPF